MAALAIAASNVVPSGMLAQRPASDARPTVAVMDFTNGALLRHADYEALGKGIAGMLNTELGANPALRVVERENIRHLLEEQNLDSSGRVSTETAVQIGRLLGAQHMIFGAFVVNPSGRMRLDTRTVSVETSEIEFVASKSGDADDVEQLVVDVGRQMNERMKLPPLAPRPARPSSAPAAPRGAPFRAVMLYSRAVEEKDRGNRDRALELCRAALTLNPHHESAQQMLAQLGGKS